ncbi:M16 family metallopeptidase [Pseudomonas gingeri]|uniref:M16 family metallopeptidase n=1 Tax=Pseudomonas gingeri TaxID=117681 RepID=UPI0015B9A3B9|nr:pitrilysin family protein [Pseudomonas gingeri]NWD47633.1 insulinase family protein [Pseudomonas gingeri]
MSKRPPVLSSIVLALFAGLAIPDAQASTTVDPLQSLGDVRDLVPVPSPLPVRGWKTLNGTKVLFVETHGLPLIDVAVSFAAGSRHDGDHHGLAAMTLSLLNEGTQDKDVDTIMSAFDSLGAQITNGIDRDHAYFTLRSLSDEAVRLPALQLLSEILSKPSFTMDAIRRVKSELLDQQLRQDSALSSGISHRFPPSLYPRHPYGQPLYGTRDSIAQITVEQLRAFHQKTYSAGNTVILLVGDLSEEQAQRLSVQISDALPKGPALPPTASAERRDSIVGKTHLERPTTLVQLDLAQIAPPRRHPDYVALHVASLIFGGGFDNRLMKELREQHGITYSVSSQLTDWQAHGPFHISLAIPPQYSDAVLQRVRQMFAAFLRDGPTEQELQSIKQSMRGEMALRGASNADILQALILIGRHDLPLSLTDFAEQAQRLTRERIKAALNSHFDAQGWVVTSAGPTVTQQPLPEARPQATSCQPGPLPRG